MNNRIIRMPLEADIPMVALKPAVERVVQKQVGEKRARDAPNARGNFHHRSRRCRVSMGLDHCLASPRSGWNGGW